VGYREALSEMLRADALLLMQASNCNAQIPAKLYEYMRAGRPLLCLADPIGDTARTVRAAGIETLAPLDDARAISHLLMRFLAAPQSLASRATAQTVRGANRAARAEQLAALLGQLAAA